jgi:hypothetical protein
MIRTLELSREIKVFLAVISVTSVFYIYMTTREPPRIGPPPKVTPTADLDVGKEFEMTLTLITADERDLGCAADEKVGEFHCGFQAAARPWRESNGDPGKAEDTLQPYMTIDNVNFLIPGLWKEPAVAKRLSEEPYAKYERDQLRRFNATCKMKIEGKMPKFKVRWEMNRPWGDSENVWIGSVRECKVSDA